MIMRFRRLTLIAITILLAAAGCGRREEDVTARTRTYLNVAEPQEVSELTVPDLVRGADGTLYMTLFIHSQFPSATETHDAVALLVSTDDGATWTERSRVPSKVTYGAWGHDLAMDEAGRLFFTWGASHRPEDSPVPFKAILCARSDDGGRTWRKPVRVSSATAGQRRAPAIAASGDVVFIAWLDDGSRERPAPPQQQTDVHYSVSRDGGETWSESICIEPDLDKKDSASGEPSVLIGSDGALHCAYFSIRRYEGKNRGGFWIATSRDGGRRFSNDLYDVGALGDLCLREVNGRLCLAAVYIKSIKQITMQNPKTAQQVHFFIRDEEGAKWSDAVRVDDDTSEQHKRHLTLLPMGPQRLAAVWYDERGGVYAAVSPDGGESWGKNVELLPSLGGTVALDAVADPDGGAIHTAVSKVKIGPGDKTHFVTGTVEAE